MKRNGSVPKVAGRERQRRRWLDRREEAIRAAGIAESSAKAAAAETAARLGPSERRVERFERRLAEMETTLLASQGRLLESQEHLARRVNELGVALAALRRDTMVSGALGARSPEAPVNGDRPSGNGSTSSFPLDYDALIQRVRTLIEAAVPQGARVSVVSRGDEELLRLEGRTGCHFPVREDGGWAGYHPKDSEAAIEHLERLRANGVSYFVLPNASDWWLEYYEAFARYLESRYRLVAHREDTGRVYSLSEGRPGTLPTDMVRG
jgi:hypothetical protein